MSRSWSLTFAAAILVAAFTASVDCRRTYSASKHSYPSHGGLSGSGQGHHSYPQSSGLSGTGGGSGSHAYPPSRGLSGNNGGHSYPNSPGLSGKSSPGAHAQSVYNPPPQIHYTPVHGAPPAHPYPVYHGSPPVYVNQIHDSGSKFSTILTGLALYNLGRSTAGGHGSSPQPKDDNGESCALRIVQDMNVERVKIPCYIVSTFTVDNTKASLPNNTANSTTQSPILPTTQAPASVPTVPPSIGSVQNVTANITASTNNTKESNINNSTVTSNVSAAVPPVANNTGTVVSQGNTTTLNITSEPVDALNVKGQPLELKKDARCFVERTTKTMSTKKEIECGLLQQYALQSIKKQQPHPSSAVSYSLLSQFSVCALSAIVYLAQ